ncbi:MAG: glutamate-5-semialdehyde dehydrogenase, partial [Treponema sp.]|nr:glutamate-5-semialdehyde dehydrogenase [Treponema sp.]
MDSLVPVFHSLKNAQKILALQTRKEKDAALAAAAAAIDKNRPAILEANGRDLARAREAGMREALVDRLLLNEKKIDSIVGGIHTVIRLEDPVGRIKTGWTLPNGLVIEERTVPIGVAAIIYESRPNVTVDAFSLAYKSGCAILLRGSSSALWSNKALVGVIKGALASAGGVAEALALAESGSRDEVDEILGARGFIDVVLPRGGRELIRRVVDHARIPVIETGEGNCHIYVDAGADISGAVDIIENAKLQKPGVCNAVETVLIHRGVLPSLMPLLAARLAGKAELRCDGPSKAALRPPFPAGLVLKDAVEEDWATEFLDYILAVKTVDSTAEAIEHINTYGTKNSEAI